MRENMIVKRIRMMAAICTAAMTFGMGGVTHAAMAEDAAERDMLVAKGWKHEGIGWYSGGDVQLWRQYNPNVDSNTQSGSHNYTANGNERNMLVKSGWRDEGKAWKGTGTGHKVNLPQCPVQVNWKTQPAASSRIFPTTATYLLW